MPLVAMIMERDVLIQTHRDGFLNKIPRWWFQIFFYFHPYLDVSVLIGLPPNHPFLIGFSIINHPFWGTTIFGNTHLGKMSNLTHMNSDELVQLNHQLAPVEGRNLGNPVDG